MGDPSHNRPAPEAPAPGGEALPEGLAAGAREARAHHASEARFAAAFDQAAIGIAQLDLEGRILKANQRLCEILGYAPGELAGKLTRELSPGEAAQATWERTRRLIAGEGTSFTEEKRNLRKDGTWTWISLTLSLVRGPDLEPDHLVAIVEDIQARKEAEAQVRIWLGAFRACTHGIALGEVATGTFSACNPAFAAMLGRTEAEVDGAAVLEAFVPAERGRVRELIARVDAEGRRRFEAHMLRRDGTPFPAEVDLVNLPDADGTPRYQVGTVVDASERREAERALRDSEEMLRAILDSMGPAVAVLDEAGTLVHVNRSWVRTAQGSDASWDVCRGVGLDYLAALESLAPAADLAPIRAGLRAVRSGRIARFDAEFLGGAPGQARWFHLGVAPLAGSHQGLVVIHTDISAHVKADRDLRASEERFSAVFMASPVAILLTRLSDRRVLDANPAFYELSGLAPGDVVGRTSKEFRFWEDLAARQEAMDQALAAGSLRNFELGILRADGTRGRALTSSEVVEFGGESILVVLVQDITEAVEAREKEREMEREVSHLQRLESVGRLAGGVAHDMNNVLGAILAVSSVLKLQHGDSPDIARLADVVAQAAGRGRDLVRGLTDFARKEVRDAAPVDLNTLLEHEAQLLEHTTFKRIGIALDLERPLPEVKGEASALSNVLMNLCVNACDAMPRGGTLTLRSRAASPGWVEAAVEDTGEGMTPEVAARAMEPFFTTKPAGKGTGLGLSIVFGTVKAHGGTVDIRSVPGQGTAVILGFPTLDAREAPRAREAEGPRPGQSLRILLVDDDELIRTTLPPLLRSLGHRPEVASSGLDALRRLKGQAEVDLVLLDVNMPGLDGFDTLARLRLLRPSLPVIVATGHRDPAADERLGGIPGVRRLDKPFTADELEALIGRGTA